jgi:hypothetical protein
VIAFQPAEGKAIGIADRTSTFGADFVGVVQSGWRKGVDQFWSALVGKLWMAASLSHERSQHWTPVLDRS